VADVHFQRVLDVGCGAGQQLRPFVARGGVLGVGTDRNPAATRVARTLFKTLPLGGRVAFVHSRAEELPFRSGTFDIVLSRLALPYTINHKALSEMARVMRRGGLVLLQFHHLLFYLYELKASLWSGKFRTAVHDVAVLVGGMCYLVTGRQWSILVAGEVFQTLGSLRRELSRCDLDIRGSMPDSNPLTPSLILVKK
jgi:ubiquinone/menaquinone biosynthesis C-methylase UbiE